MKFRALLTSFAVLSSAVLVTAFNVLGPGPFSFQARITTGIAGDGFSDSIALDGDTAVSASEAGFHVFVRSGTAWEEQQVLVPSDGMAVVSFPRNASISGDTIVIGGRLASINGNANQGAAYVFVRNGTAWSQQQRLTASDGGAQSRFGHTVAIQENTIIVCASTHTVGANQRQGVAYVFTRSGTAWTEQTILVANDGAAFQEFGQSVTIDGDTVAVGTFAPKAVYLFVGSGTTWSQQQRLSVCEPSASNLCQFGRTLALDGDTLVTANNFLNVGNNTAQGGAYIFTRTSGMWAQVQRLTAADGLTNSLFGTGVAIDGQKIVVGAPADVNVPDSGAVYVFVRPEDTWIQDQKLQVPNITYWNSFGSNVALDADTLLVSSPRDNGSSPYVGAVYIYVSPIATPTPTPTATATATPTATPFASTEFDYDGDDKSDISVFRPSSGAWYLQQSIAGQYGVEFGYGTDKIAPADYDGDGKTDVAVYRPETGIWYIFNSSNGSVSYEMFGIAEDLPAPGDYDGDGRADVSVFRPSTATWYRQNSSDGSFYAIQFGLSEDKPTVGDFDGDGHSDVAIFRPSVGAWYQYNSSNNQVTGEEFGFGTDVITPADYDGDGKTDLAVFRPSNGFWYVRNSNGPVYTAFPFGLADDIPAAGDFDGDSKADLSVFRPSDGTWYRMNSSDGSFYAYPFGTNGDKPTQTAYIY